jgi:hypothetical protein
MRRRILPLVLASASVLSARYASAQAPCVPPFCIEGKTPTVGGSAQTPPGTVQTPGVDVNAEARRRAEIDAQWNAYLAWEASMRVQLRASIEAGVRARIHAEANAAARLTPDPYMAIRPPVTPPYIPPEPGFPRMEVGLLAFCFGAWTGPDSPFHAGYCPPVRLRFDERWALALDPSVLAFHHGSYNFSTVGFHPAVLYSFAHGVRSQAESHAYLRAGADAWFPVYELERTPNAFAGGHVGIGVTSAGGGIFVNTELRGLVRAGIGSEPVPSGEVRMSSIRAGFELRFGFGFSF